MEETQRQLEIGTVLQMSSLALIFLLFIFYYYYLVFMFPNSTQYLVLSSLKRTIYIVS